MGTSVSNVMETITTAVPFPALSARHVRLKTHLANTTAYSAAQTAPIIGRTLEREQAFGSTTNAAACVAGAVLSYAQAHGLVDLATKVDITPTRLKTGRMGRRVELFQQIHDAAAGVVPELADYRVTEITLADLQTQISNLRALLPVARNSIVMRRVMTQKLWVEFREMRRLLDKEIDPLIEQLRTSSPDLYAQYHGARMIVGPSHVPREESAAPAAAPAPAPIAHAA
jgi:hypothetical protein